jgi:membrane protease YdiL (CAAX protease family)
MARRYLARVTTEQLLAVGRMVLAVLAFQSALILTAVVLFFFGLSLVPEGAQGSFGLLSLGLAEGLAMVAVLAVWRFVDRRPIVELGFRRPRALWRWFRGAAVATLMMGFVVLVWYTLLDGATWDANPDPARTVAVLLGGLLGYLIQGPAEEVLFRGYLLENLRDQWGVRWAVVVSSIAFGLFHGFNPAFGPLPLVNLVLFGVATALYKVRIDDDQLWGVCGIHTIWNWLQQVVFGLPNSGIATASDNAAFVVTPNASLPGPIWGGGFGPEGTLGATLVLLAVVSVAVRRRQLPSRPG